MKVTRWMSKFSGWIIVFRAESPHCCRGILQWGSWEWTEKDREGWL